MSKDRPTANKLTELTDSINRLETLIGSTEAKDVIKVQALTAIVNARVAILTANGRQPGIRR